jgi:hypothetical protein
MDNVRMLGFEVTRRLRDARPDRYQDDDSSWQQSTYDWLIGHVRENELQQRLVLTDWAWKMVRGAETRQKKAVNRLLREIGEQRGVIPGSWVDLKRAPLSLDGKEHVVVERITSADLATWELTERRRNDRNFARVALACDGAAYVREHLEAQGATDWGRLDLSALVVPSSVTVDDEDDGEGAE